MAEAPVAAAGDDDQLDEKALASLIKAPDTFLKAPQVSQC